MGHSVVPEKLSKPFSIGVQLLYSMLVPTVQRSDSATCTHISSPLELSSHPGSITPAWASQSTDLSSLCYTAASHSLFHTWWWASLGLRWYKIHLQCRRPGFNPWVGKIPWRRAWQPTAIFLPGEFQGQRSFARLQSPWCCKKSDTSVTNSQCIYANANLLIHPTLPSSYVHISILSVCVCIPALEISSSVSCF